MDATDKELQDVADSWVDMSLLNKSNNEVVDSAAKAGDMIAFDWVDGGSVKTMSSNVTGAAESDAETSFCNSSDDEDGESEQEEGSGDEEDDYNGSGDDYDNGEDEDLASDLEGDEDDVTMEEAKRNLEEEQMWEDIGFMEEPVKTLFKDLEERQAIWDTLLEGDIPAQVIQLTERYNRLQERRVELELEMTGLYDNETQQPGDKFHAVYESLESEYEQVELLINSGEVRLRDALRKLKAREKEDNENAQTKNSVVFEEPVTGIPQTSDKMEVDQKQDTAQSEGTERNSG